MQNYKLKTVTEYQISQYKLQSIIMLGVMTFNLILGIIFKANGTEGGSVDVIPLCFALICGLILLRISFNFSICNGVSRITFFKASLLTISIVTIAWAIITTILLVISEQFAQSLIIVSLLFDTSLISKFIWLVSSIFFMFVLTMFISLLLITLSKRAKYILMALLISLAPLVVLFNILIPGFMSGVLDFLLLFIGVTSGQPSIYLSSLMLIMLALCLLVASWFIIRRIEVK